MRIAKIAAAALLACGLLSAQSETLPISPTGNCSVTWATHVDDSHAGPSHQGTPASAALGNDTVDWFSLGSGGSITVSFGALFSNDGSPAIDLFVDEYGVEDCYWLCLRATDATTVALLQAAGVQAMGNDLYQLPGTFCGDAAVDLDALVPNTGPGELLLEAVMVEDDGGGNGAEVVRISVLTGCTPPAPVDPLTGCVQWADSVISSQQGSGVSGSDPHNAVGDTPGTFFRLGNGGWIKLGFAGPFSTTGDAADDLFVDVGGAGECYRIVLRPADAFTLNAVQAAGLPLHSSNPGEWYRLPGEFCGDQRVDLDAYLPGYPAGTLKLDGFKVWDDGNGAKVVRVQVLDDCTPAPPCAPAWANEVLSSIAGLHQGTSPDPTKALGNTPGTRFSLGQGGEIVLAFGLPFSTDGTASEDLFVDEYNVEDCYTLGLKPDDAATAAALQAAGLNPNAAGYYMLPDTFCGETSVDLDAYIPGFTASVLLFSELRILDDGSSGDGAEIERVRASLACSSRIVTCEGEFATSVRLATAGTMDPQNALGDTPNTFYRLEGGCLVLSFDNAFRSSQDATPDLFIDEWNDNDCYTVALRPASLEVAAVLQAANLTEVGGFFELPQAFCGDAQIDFDAFFPAPSGLKMRFTEVRICDDATGGSAEIERVRAELVCDNARICGSLWFDADCDGLRDVMPFELPYHLADSIALYDETGTLLSQTVTVTPEGDYCFFVDPGSYRVVKNTIPAGVLWSPRQVGSDPSVDSDFDTSGVTSVLTVLANEVVADIDGGLCVDCPPGTTAFKLENLPACGVPEDPILTVTPPLLGSLWMLETQTLWPGSLVTLYFSPGPPQPFGIMTPLGTCFTYLDYHLLFTLAAGHADLNGAFFAAFPLPADPALAGLELIFQARVCDPNVPGPIAGFPDWFSNGVHIGLGCP